MSLVFNILRHTRLYNDENWYIYHIGIWIWNISMIKLFEMWILFGFVDLMIYEKSMIIQSNAIKKIDDWYIHW